MTVTLRTNSNAKATTKGSAMSHSELDNNFVHFLDTGITVVGDDSSGTEFTPGDDLKIAGGTNITTAVSGPTLTVTGSSTPTFSNISVGSLNVFSSGLTSDSNADISLLPGGTGTVVMHAITVDDNKIQATRTNEDLKLEASGTGSIDANSNVRFNKTYTEDINTLTYGAGTNVDCSLAPIHKITLTGNCDFRIDNLGTGQSVTIIITQDSGGSNTATFAETDSTAVKFAGGAPTLTTAANSIDVVTIFNDGTSHLGNIALDLKAS